MVKSKETLETMTLEKKNLAEQQISDYQKRIDFDTKDYTIELLVDKFKKKEFFVPDYQRNFIWNDNCRNSRHAFGLAIFKRLSKNANNGFPRSER